MMLKTPAIILKKQNLGETDRILTIFSPVLGKKRVIAKAVRRPLSKLAGHLDTMMLSQLMITDEDELPKVTSAELAEPFDEIRNSLELLNKAFAITKLVERVVVEDVSERPIFQLTVDSIKRLNDRDKWVAVWLYFLSKLNNRLGLSMTEFSCHVCHKPLQSGRWLIDEHVFVCDSCPVASSHLRLQENSFKLLKLLNSKPYQMIHSINIPSPVAHEIEEVYLRLITQWLNKSWKDFSSFS